MKTHLILLIIVLASPFGFAQLLPGVDGARASALGRSTGALTDVWAVVNNPACIAGIESTNISAYYENRFLIKNLNTSALAVVMPLKKLSVGIDASKFGYSLFSRNRIGISIAKKLSSTFDLGGKIAYYGVRQSDIYSNTHLLSMQLGMCYAQDNYAFGVTLFNPVQTKIGNNSVKLERSLSLSTTYKVSSEVVLMAETNLGNENKASFCGGIEYSPNKTFDLRMGFNSLTKELSFGFGINVQQTTLDISSSIHPTLGPNTHAGLSYKFK